MNHGTEEKMKSLATAFPSGDDDTCGLTKREYIAIKMLQGIMASGEASFSYEVSRVFSVSESVVSQVKTRKIWKHC